MVAQHAELLIYGRSMSKVEVVTAQAHVVAALRTAEEHLVMVCAGFEAEIVTAEGGPVMVNALAPVQVEAAVPDLLAVDWD